MFVTDATSLPRLMQCKGSVRVVAAVPPDPDTSARDEGNAADWLAQEIFEGRLYPETATGVLAANGYIITDEMVDFVKRYLIALEPGAMQSDTSWSLNGVAVNGRCDHWNFRDGTLTIDDLKYGYGIVEPYMNFTLISHAIGLLVRNPELQQFVTTIRLVIHQPRAYHLDGPIREWPLSAADLMLLRSRITHHLTADNDDLSTGPECAKCLGRHTCPAARLASMNAIDATSQFYTDDLNAEQLSYQIELLEHADKSISTRLSALKELALHRAKAGEQFPNHYVDAGLANRSWKPGFSNELARMLTGVSFDKPATISPAEAERKGAPEWFLKQFTERRSTAAKLVRGDINQRVSRAMKGRN